MSEHHDAHPEETHPLGVPHEKSHEERRLTLYFTIVLVAAIISIPILSAITWSPTLNVIVGLFPLLLTIGLDLWATNAGFKPSVYWGILLIVHVLGLAFLWFLNLALTTPVNIGSALSLCIVLGLAITAFAMVLEGRPHRPKQKETKHTVEFKEEKLEEYVQSIEDKVKGINFVIGRVYRSSNGGSAELRERLRVPREWYDEFYSIKSEDLEKGKNEHVKQAKVLLRKIHDRLKLLASKEKDVFKETELDRLKNIARNKNGEDAIIDVLKTNDRDPVESYYVSAVDFCERILDELDKR